MSEEQFKIWKQVEAKGLEKLEKVEKALASTEKEGFEEAHKDYCDFIEKLAETTGLTTGELDKHFTKLWAEKKPKNFYFTFGSSEEFPYTRGQYLIVKAQDIKEAAKKYKKKYPSRYNENILNCADYYSQKAWDERVKRILQRNRTSRSNRVKYQGGSSRPASAVSSVGQSTRLITGRAWVRAPHGALVARLATLQQRQQANSLSWIL